MAIRTLSSILLYVPCLSLLFLLTGCPGECINTTYSFQASALVSPQKEFLKVGDTLWVESSTSTTFRDANSGTDVDFSHAENVGSGLKIGQLQAGSDSIPGALQNFDFTLLQGNLYPPDALYPNRSRYFRYEEKDGEYRFKVRMVCQKPGTYVLFTSDAVNVYRKANGSCGRADITITLSNSDKHLNYLKELYYKGKPIDPIDQTHGYCFVVQ